MTIDPVPFSVTSTSQDGRAVLTVRGELDLATAPQLEQAVDEQLSGAGDLVLDLRELDFMDSTGLRIIITAHARASAEGRSFALLRPAPDSTVAKILSIAGLDTQITLVDDPGQLG